MFCDALSKLFDHYNTLNKIERMRVSTNLFAPLSICYVDDVMLFMNAERAGLRALKEILLKYEQSSGQCGYDKSILWETREKIDKILP